jgi:hypothetical protein
LKILFKFGLSCTSKAFSDPPFSFPLHLCIHLEPITFWIEILAPLKKRLEILVGKSLDL